MEDLEGDAMTVAMDRLENGRHPACAEQPLEQVLPADGCADAAFGLAAVGDDRVGHLRECLSASEIAARGALSGGGERSRRTVAARPLFAARTLTQPVPKNWRRDA